MKRLCFKKGVSVVGGSSKLVKNSMIAMNIKSCITWSDNCYTDGGVYNKIGFKEVSKINRDFYYYQNNKKYNKQVFKNELKNKPDNLSLIEYEISKNLRRVWDSGKIKWIYQL
jgi:hypothetical protein